MNIADDAMLIISKRQMCDVIETFAMPDDVRGVT